MFHYKFFFLLALTIKAICAGAQPVAIHPDNPHYFLYRGQPRFLITSAEHYGAVLNLDFDYKKYLETLHSEKMDYTRVFTGVYIENSESFGIERNPLAPLNNRLITPWARSDQSGYINGGNKFDLDQWNPAYFERLIDFVGLAEQYGVIVEVTLFSSIYKEGYWRYAPFYHENNVNHTDSLDRQVVHTLDNGNIFKYQEAMVRKIVSELNPFDNVIYEIQNEPWSDQQGKEMRLNMAVNPKEQMKWFGRSNQASEASLEWQQRITEIIRAEELNLPKKHLIAQNYCNYWQPIGLVEENIDIMNFHYVLPMALEYNYGHNRPISFDESGFAGKMESEYRKQAWRFMLAGGAIFNNLDYSFVPGYEDGTFEKNESPGSGTAALRDQLRILKETLRGSSFVKMKPARELVIRAPGFYYQVLADPGSEYLVYLEGEGACNLDLEVPEANYTISWIDPLDGKVIINYTDSATDGRLNLSGPVSKEDLVVLIVK